MKKLHTFLFCSIIGCSISLWSAEKPNQQLIRDDQDPILFLLEGALGNLRKEMHFIVKGNEVLLGLEEDEIKQVLALKCIAPNESKLKRKLALCCQLAQCAQNLSNIEIPQANLTNKTQEDNS